MGGGFGAKTDAGDYTLIAAELATRTGRPVRCTLTRREENVSSGNRNATIQRLVVGARSDGTLDRALGRLRERGRLVRLERVHRGADADALRVPEREDGDARREGQHAADAAVPRAGLRRGHVRARVPARRARGEARPRPARAAAPQLRRHRARHDRAYSGKNLDECYRRAEPHWERRHEVRAARPRPSSAASAWPRRSGTAAAARRATRGCALGADGRAAVVTALQDVGSGTKTALAQIAAEELGFPLERVTIVAGDSARGPYATLSGGSSTTPSMGPATRAAAADAKRQLLELAAQRYDRNARTSTSRAGWSSTRAARAGPSARCSSCSATAQILGTGARGPNPAGHGRAHVRHPRRRGRGRRRDRRGHGRPDRGDPRHRPRDQPARRVEPGRGRDHPGHRPHALRGAADRPGDRARSSRARSTPTGCRRSPTCPRS